MLPKSIPARLIAKTGHRIRCVLKCPVPERLRVPVMNGEEVVYERRFALIICGEEPIIKEVFFYESDEQGLGKV